MKINEILNAREKIKIFRGNLHDSRNGQNDTSWTMSHDWVITLPDGREAWFHTSFYTESGTVAQPISCQPAFHSPEKVEFDNIPYCLKRQICELLFPKADKDTLRIFIMSEQEAVAQAEQQWISEHLIEDEWCTREILRQIGGYWDEEIPCDRIGIRRLRRGDKFYDVQVERQLSTQEGYYYSPTVSVYDPQEEARIQKEFGRRVRKLATAAGVPFPIAAMLKDLSPQKRTENLAALQAIHSVRYDEKLSKSVRHELLECGINRRCEAINWVLGPNADALKLEGQMRTARLARYLAGEEM